MKLYINVTSEQGELLERVAIEVDSSNDPEGVAIEQVARDVVNCISFKFNIVEE